MLKSNICFHILKAGRNCFFACAHFFPLLFPLFLLFPPPLLISLRPRFNHHITKKGMCQDTSILIVTTCLIQPSSVGVFTFSRIAFSLFFFLLNNLGVRLRLSLKVTITSLEDLNCVVISYICTIYCVVGSSASQKVVGCICWNKRGKSKWDGMEWANE